MAQAPGHGANSIRLHGTTRSHVLRSNIFRLARFLVSVVLGGLGLISDWDKDDGDEKEDGEECAEDGECFNKTLYDFLEVGLGSCASNKMAQARGHGANSIGLHGTVRSQFLQSSICRLARVLISVVLGGLAWIHNGDLVRGRPRE